GVQTCALPIFLLGLPGAADAADRVWPGSAECATTLQACADAALDGDRVLIATTAAIDEDITLTNRSLTLTAAGTLRPSFAPGRRILVSFNAGATSPVFAISRLKRVNAAVRLQSGGSGIATFDVRELDLERAPGGAPAYIAVTASSGATVNATLRENRVHGTPAGINAGLIELSTA